ncbi:unnamed protein product [Strongylus vulgaris]|uniref:Uncharacterized protein n=1 Tax=Strongylus vulgaris TaxID=40348 RepID=A0A3P7J613_STRVU|nr:unnamed protein product [Strongylus vulgaris]
MFQKGKFWGIRKRRKNRVKVSPVGRDQYVVSFTVNQSSVDVKWGLYMSSAPYDMAMITGNCKRARKSPCLMRNLPLEEKTVTAWQIIGHTVVISSGMDTVACATVILPGLPLMRASFHTPPVEGHIHVIPFLNMVRILPDLKYSSEFENEEPQKAVIEWAFTKSCEGNMTVPEDMNGNELGVDSRSTITIARSFGIRFRHGDATHKVDPIQVFRDDCLDMSTETVHRSFDNFYPTINIFGAETIALKSLVTDDSCGPLRPQFPRPAATAHFMYPIVGRLVLVDMDDRILLTGELRQIQESEAKRATVQALVNKHKVFSAVTAHAVPVDMSITESHPCGLESLGPSKQKWWIQRLAAILSGEDNDTTVIIGSKQLVTGPDSVLGISVQLKEKNAVSCGHFEPLTEKIIAVAKFENVSFGYVKMTQHGTSNWATGIPTEIYYSLSSAEVEWEFVTQVDSCSDAPVYDPFHLNRSFCSSADNVLCAIGDVQKKSGPLTLNTRRHLVVSNLPLSGPYSEEDWRLSEMLQMFNVEQKKFKADADFECGEELPMGPQTSSSPSAAFFILFYVVLLNS